MEALKKRGLSKKFRKSVSSSRQNFHLRIIFKFFPKICSGVICQPFHQTRPGTFRSAARMTVSCSSFVIQVDCICASHFRGESESYCNRRPLRRALIRKTISAAILQTDALINIIYSIMRRIRLWLHNIFKNTFRNSTALIRNASRIYSMLAYAVTKIISESGRTL